MGQVDWRANRVGFGWRARALAAVVVAMAPGVASAGQVAVVLGPVRVRAYELTAVAYPGAAHQPPALIIYLTRLAGGRVLLGGLGPAVPRFVQSHSFLAIRMVGVRVSGGLGSGRVRARLGRYGQVDLRFSGTLAHRRSCFARQHVGRAVGTFRLIPGGRYFGTIKLRELSSVVGVSTCETSRDAAVGVNQPQPGLLSLGSRSTPVTIDTSDPLEWSFSYARQSGAVSVDDVVGVNNPPSWAMTTNSSLSSAMLRAVGPFLTGSANYTATTPEVQRSTDGNLTGTLTALFDSPGPVQLTALALPATLSEFP